MRLIINPAMIASWVFGGLMLWANPALFEQGWMHIKLTAVILMTILHHAYVRWWKAFREDKNRHDSRYFRIWNEATDRAYGFNYNYGGCRTVLG